MHLPYEKVLKLPLMPVLNEGVLCKTLNKEMLSEAAPFYTEPGLQLYSISIKIRACLNWGPLVI